MILTRRCIGLLIVVLLVIPASGCGSRQAVNPNWPDRFPVTGSVTYQGKAIEGADVCFMSTTKKATATGKTDSAGRFTLTTFLEKDGAVSGSQMVTIRRVDVVDKTPKDVDLSAGGKAVPPEITWIIPEKFSISGKSGLSADVSETGPNDFKFELK